MSRDCERDAQVAKKRRSSEARYVLRSPVYEPRPIPASSPSVRHCFRVGILWRRASAYTPVYDRIRNNGYCATVLSPDLACLPSVLLSILQGAMLRIEVQGGACGIVRTRCSCSVAGECSRQQFSATYIVACCAVSAHKEPLRPSRTDGRPCQASW